MPYEGDLSPRPAAETLNIPSFTLKELYERLDSVLNEGIAGIVYSLKGYPNLAVKEIQLDSLDRAGVDVIRLELATLPNSSHPGILKCYQVIEDEGLIYIVMDRHNKTLERLITEHKRKKSPVSIRIILSIVRQVAAALAYLHSVSDAGAGRPAHCDLRPTNVLISADGEHFIIADLGLSRDALRSGSTIASTVTYMAPEILLHNETSPASNIWSLGVILYELVTLKRPDFLEGKGPRDVFTDGWAPDLSDVTDGFIRGILERIFVLEPEGRLTTKELCEVLTTFDVPVSELGAQYTMLKYKCSSLETALNSANARIEFLEEDAKARSNEIASLKMEFARIDVLEDQCKEYLAMIKALEDKIMQLSDRMDVADHQPGLLLLPRLIRAARMNSTETIQTLLKERLGIGQRDEQGMTALMHAAQQGYISSVKLLAEAEKDLQDKNGWTALMHATHNNHPEVVKVLAPHEHGKRNNNNRTALMMAAEKGFVEIASLLVPHKTDSEGDTALSTTANNPYVKTIRVIVGHEYGFGDSHGRTALMIAAQEGNLKMVEVLIEHEKELKDDNGCTALVHAARAGHRNVATFLMAYEKDVIGWTMLMCAAALGDIDMISQYLNERNQRNRQGQTALILAAQNGRDEAVKFLIEYEGSASGWTSLIYFAYLDQVDTVKEKLHEKGCADITGMTALMWAAWQGHKEAVEILLEHEKEMKDRDGNTAFVHALKNKHTDIALLLREHEAPSWTPRMCTSFTEDVTMVREHPSEKSEKNNNSETALAIAIKVDHEDVVNPIDPTDDKDVITLMRTTDRDDPVVVRTLVPLQPE
ncbi:Kinase, NEK [Giardia lamblia P15]|uniref:Kinase, NEK n=1 Tax=Giardia intestinalis (strain P15) TaxID=658858 RepID=E1EZU6_GIAIA|nr:Kinase, NEK [Giardia lamblia P15]